MIKNIIRAVYISVIALLLVFIIEDYRNTNEYSEREDNFHMDQATLVHLKHHKSAESGGDKSIFEIPSRSFSVSGHMTEKGKGHVFAFRKLTTYAAASGNPPQVVSYMTIYHEGALDYEKGKGILNLEDNKITAYYSRFPFGEPHRGGCAGYGAGGFLKYKIENDGMVICEIQTDVIFKRAREFYEGASPPHTQFCDPRQKSVKYHEVKRLRRETAKYYPDWENRESWQEMKKDSGFMEDAKN